MKTVAFLNQKGGVGKTSTCHHLSGHLSKKGLRVLLVDADPQSNLTQGILGSAATRKLDPGLTIASLFDPAGGPSAVELVTPTPFPGVSLLPGSELMVDFNLPKPHEAGELQYALRDALAEVADNFDLCLIDCAPSVQLNSWSALVAASGVVVPLQAEDYGAQGVHSIQRSIAKVKAGPNRGLELVGFLLTMFNKRLGVHVDYELDLRQTYGPAVFDSVVPLATDFKDAVTAHKPIGFYKPRCAASKAFDVVGDEFIERVNRVAAERKVA